MKSSRKHAPNQHQVNFKVTRKKFYHARLEIERVKYGLFFTHRDHANHVRPNVFFFRGSVGLKVTPRAFCVFFLKGVIF